MDELLTRAEVEARLAQKSDAINRRINAMGDEVVTTTEDLKQKVLTHPLLGVGAMLAAGLVVGWLVSGRRRPSSMEAVMNAYADLVVEEARVRMQRGVSPEEAMAESLRTHSPRILVPPSPAQAKKRGLIRSVGRIVAGVLLNTAIAAGTERLSTLLTEVTPSDDG